MKRVRLWLFALTTWLSVCPGPSAAESTPLQEAYMLYEAGELDAAQNMLGAFRETLDPTAPDFMPTVARIHWQDAQILAAKGNFAQAIAESDASVDFASQLLEQANLLTAIYRGERGKMLMKAGFMERAYDDLSASVEVLSKTPELEHIKLDMQRYEAMTLLEMGDIRAAHEEFSDLAEDWQARDQPDKLFTALVDLARAGLRDRVQRSDASRDVKELVEAATAILPSGNPLARGELAVLRGSMALQQSELAQAEAYFKEAARDFSDPARRANANLLRGQVLLLRGEALEAEALYTSAVKDIREALGQSHPVLARTLVGLGLVTAELGRPSEAISYLRQAVRVLEDSAGFGTTPAAEARVELAMVFNSVREYENARSVAEAALEILEDGQSNLRRAYAHSALGFALAGLGENEAAFRHLHRALDDMAQLRGEMNSDLAPGHIQLAELKISVGALDEAEALLDKAFRILDKDVASGPRLRDSARAVEILFQVQVEQSDVAAERARAAIDDLRADLQQTTATCDPRPLDVAARHRLLTTALDALADNQPPSQTLSEELFEAAQIAHAGVTAQTITRRNQQENANLQNQSLMREHDRLLTEKCALKRQVMHAISGLTRNAEVDRIALDTRVADLTQQIEALNEEVGASLQSGLSGTPIISLKDLQQTLRPREAMLLHVTGKDRTHLFWVEADRLLRKQSALGQSEATAHVLALRSGINISNVGADDDLPPVPLGDAFALYDKIFAPFASEMERVKTVFFVADGALRTLPASMLLTQDYGTRAEADPRSLAQLEWLGDQTAITVLPSPAAHAALRNSTSRTENSMAFVGIGNPKFARDHYALPDTEKELRNLADSLGGAGPRELVTGRHATETWVRTSAEVRQARVLAFATHGLLNRELGVTEPALMLASPPAGTEDDDGFLTASEIAQLDLRAEWVILSACNTAAGRDDRAEGLSGLANSFFAAGAKSLLVSHWYVPSSAASALTVFSAQALSEPGTSHAEALRLAMRRVRSGEGLDKTSNPRFAHPAYWAPFVVVGQVN